MNCSSSITLQCLEAKEATNFQTLDLNLPLRLDHSQCEKRGGPGLLQRHSSLFANSRSSSLCTRGQY